MTTREYSILPFYETGFNKGYRGRGLRFRDCFELNDHWEIAKYRVEKFRWGIYSFRRGSLWYYRAEGVFQSGIENNGINFWSASLACPWLSCRCCFKLEPDDVDTVVSWRFKDGIEVPRVYEPRVFPLDFPLPLVWLLLLPMLYADPWEPTSQGSAAPRKCRIDTFGPL